MLEVEVDGRILVTILLNPKNCLSRSVRPPVCHADVLRCQIQQMLDKKIAVSLPVSLTSCAMDHGEAYRRLAAGNEFQASQAPAGGICRLVAAGDRQATFFNDEYRAGQHRCTQAAIPTKKHEPRTKRRRPKLLPLLTVPRHITR